jgi:predicted acyl esterase
VSVVTRACNAVCMLTATREAAQSCESAVNIPSVRRIWVFIGALATLLLAPSAQAAVPNVFGGDVPCQAQANNGNVRLCSGQTETWDGTGIDVNVILPPEAQGDGPFPAIGVFHGWGGSKVGLNPNSDAERPQVWAERGYAVFSMSDRGWGGSCGAQDLPDRLNPAVCGKGYNHLMDTRYEVRDAQHFLGLLADEGRVVPDRIGTTGGSYGGGLSMALAALRNRVMMPDGSLVPWTSPAGKAMQIAVAAPEIPWTDLAYSLVPHGRTLDYVADNDYRGPRGDYPIGVAKQSFIAGLYGTGQAASNYAPPGTDPDADLTTWFAGINAGEPYEANPIIDANDLIEEITTHHSSYYIPRNGTQPAPLLIANGWTDDLFPPDEAIRFYNRTLSEFPGADVSLWFMDYGHQRGQNKGADTQKLQARQDEWFDHYLKGSGPKPAQGVTAITQTCPKDTASGGPFTAPTWDELSPGEIRVADTSSKTIAPAAGNSQSNQAFDPITGGGACATASGADQQGAATYRVDEKKPFTLMGAPTVIADIETSTPTSQVAARLVDVSPEGRATLVARGLLRPDAEGRQVFQLHANGWRFEEGHVAKLELLPNDAPYGRASNGQGPVTVSNLELRLPTLEKRGEPAPSVLPPGTEPAPGTVAAGACESGLQLKGTPKGERLKGTAGGDRLKGSAGNDRLSGKDGDDCLNGGRGKDRVSGGDGDDRIRARDGQKDRVSCGKGDDTVTIDERDRVRGCETKKR